MEKKPSILVVEDDAEMRETLSDILADKGYEVKTVGTGKEALALAKKEKFPTCLIDLKLPDITGIEVLKGLKALNPETYAIIITAYASKETAIEALKADAYCYIEKPLNMEELLAAVERASEAYQLLEDKRRAEEELRETRDYLDNIIESSADAIVVVDMKGIVRDWNKGAEGIMDYRADEVIGASNRRFFADPEEADRIMELVRKEEEIKNHRAIVLRKDGMPVHISMSAALLKDKNGVPIGTVRVSRDVTKEVELEERIKEERDNLNLIFESMADGVYLFSEDYEVEFMNKVLRDEFGDKVGSICYKVFHEREEPCPLCKHSEVMKGKTVRWEWHSRRTNRTYDLIETPLKNIDGTISKLTIVRDITERKQAEEKLKNIFASVADGITVTDLNANIIDCNQATVDMYGFSSREELIGENAFEFIALRDRQKSKENAMKTLKQGFMKDLEYICITKEGREFPVLLSPSVLRDSCGNPIAFVAVTKDITERKRAEEERESIFKELEAKNAEMERFTYVVSHDLRSPLVTTQGFVGVLRKDLEQNEIEKVENDLKYIETAVTKMDRLLSDTLQLSRIGRVMNPPEDVPSGELVQEALEQTAEQIKSSGVEVSVAEDFPAVHVDRIRIVEVLVNLIENSMNYMGEEPRPKIDIGYRIDDGETVFFVKDNGIGIELSQHEKVFELFYKLDRSSKGTGAGLAIVKRIIEVHGGRIWIESEKGKGCTACFTLPVM